ncbi:MAG: hypothetical protein R3B70_12315 [Polyangiaceae bacterium]
MRTHNPYPHGVPPQNSHVSDAIGQATRAVLLDHRGDVLAPLSPWDPASLAASSTIVEGAPPFDLPYEQPLHLQLENDSGRVATLRVARTGSLHFQGADPTRLWSGYSDLEDPLALVDWLSAHGAGPWVDPWRQWLGEHGVEARAAWRAHLPDSLRSVWDPKAETSIVSDAFLQSVLSALRAATHGDSVVIRVLLGWYGAGDLPLAARGAHEDVVRALLARFGFDAVVAVFPDLQSTAEQVGAARYLLNAGPLPPILRTAVDRLPESVRRDLVLAAGRLGESAQARLRAGLYPAPLLIAASVREVGRSNTVHLRRVICTETALFALDGTEVVRLEDGQRTALSMLLRESPMALVDGALVWRTGAVIQRRTPAGEVLPTAPAPTAEDVQAARAIT